jgi:hypothetical protein
MKDLWSAAEDIKDICVRRCDTIFYATIALTAVATAATELPDLQFDNPLYVFLLHSVLYRELLRLALWIGQNPKYATASIYGVFLGAAAVVLLRHPGPGALLYEASVYLVLRTASTILFGLNEKSVAKLYLDVLFDYYDKATPPRTPRRRAKRTEQLATLGAWGFSLPSPALVPVEAGKKRI